ncbi:hypothetical protein OROMI_032253 [Orobanche minor]
MKASRTRDSALLKQEFLKKWIKGLHLYNNCNKDNMGILDRKKAIKLSADVAMASTRKGTTHWSQALIHDVVSSTNGTNRNIVEQIIGHKLVRKNSNSNSRASTSCSGTGSTITCSKRILKRSRVIISSRRKARRSVAPRSVKPSSIARTIMKNKTRVLKSLVPGGDKMDERCLIQETLDYIVSLRVQVDVMRFLANAAERLEP